MPHEAIPEEKHALHTVISGLVNELHRFDSGILARLRRMEVSGPGEAEFWKLALNHGLRIDETGRTDKAYMHLIRILALLAPKGERGRRNLFHDRHRALGAALFDAGYSERRLTRFLTLPFAARGDALERMARWLSAKNAGAFNCTDIACLLLSTDVKYPRKLAKTYYLRFDQANKKRKESAA